MDPDYISVILFLYLISSAYEESSFRVYVRILQTNIYIRWSIYDKAHRSWNPTVMLTRVDFPARASQTMPHKSGWQIPAFRHLGCPLLRGITILNILEFYCFDSTLLWFPINIGKYFPDIFFFFFFTIFLSVYIFSPHTPFIFKCWTIDKTDKNCRHSSWDSW